MAEDQEELRPGLPGRLSLVPGPGDEYSKNITLVVQLGEEVITMFARHQHKSHHFAHLLREWLHRCNPYA
jgi:hypothetical protein